MPRSVGEIGRRIKQNYMSIRDFFEAVVLAVKPLHFNHRTESLGSLSSTTDKGKTAPFTSLSLSCTIKSAIFV